MPTVLPNPDYELDLLQQKQQQVAPDNSSIVDRHVPVDFIQKNWHTVPMNPFDGQRSLSPTVEELPDESFTTPSSPPLRPDSPIIEPIEEEMAGIFGRYGEAQREDNGVHLEAGGSLVLVEP
jgi:hypothetical protein